MGLFFNSYARMDANKYSNLDKVIEELRSIVRGKVGGIDVERVGFWDTRDIKTGAHWEQWLGDAVRKARVLVCFCSPTYFNRDYCAKEFEVFRLRLQSANAIDHRRVVIPVVWEPGSVPAAMKRFQREDATLPPDYGSTGLRALRRIKGTRGQYGQAIEALANVIANAIKATPELPELPGPVRFDALPSTFHNPGESSGGIGVTFLHPKGPSWSPRDDGEIVARVVDAVAEELKVAWHEVRADSQWRARLAQARTTGEALLVITEAGAAQSGAIKPYLEELGRARLAHCAVFIGGRASATASGTAAVEGSLTVLPVVGAPPRPDEFLKTLPPGLQTLVPPPASFPLDNLKEAADRMTEAIVRLRMEIARAQPAGRVHSPALDESAQAEGRQVQSLPTVSAASTQVTS
jgi:hypothetical protein